MPAWKGLQHSLTYASSLSMTRQKIGSCMTYRSDIVWIDSTGTSQDILMVMKSHGDILYFPVCAGSLDAVIGIVSARDYLQKRLDTPSFPLHSVLKKPLFIPESQTVDNALALLTARGEGAACVIDEYGGIEGFVTKHGLLEALYTAGRKSLFEASNLPVRNVDGSLIVNAQTSIDELQALHLLEFIPKDSTGEYYTLAGYILTNLTTIPHEGDIIDIGGYTCTILSMKGQRIDRVLIKRKDDDLP